LLFKLPRLTALLQISLGRSSKSTREPIKDGRELDEGEKSDGKFFETGANATMVFYAAEEVFDFVPQPIIVAMERRRTTARTLWRDADARVSGTESRAKVVGVEAFVADDTPLTQAAEQGFDGEKTVALALSQSECDGAPAALDNGRQLGVDPSLLRPMPSDGICLTPSSMLGFHENDRPARLSGHPRE